MATSHGLNTAGPSIKLLYILDEFPDPHAGTESQFWLLLQGLDRTQVEPSILLLRRSAFLEAHAAPTPVQVLNVPRLRSPLGLARIMAAAYRAKRSGFQVAHIFFNDSALVFPIVLKLVGIRVIVSRRDLGFWYSKVKLKVLRLQARFVDVVVANCKAVRDVVVKAERIAQEKVRVIYNGIAPRSTAEPSNRGMFGIPDDVSLIVTVANLRPLKRIDIAVRALATLRDRRRPVHLLVIGEDREGRAGASHRAELEVLARELGVSSRVHFAGKMSDPFPAIDLADICVLCSETEGLSNVIIEYMLAGKPVICTDVGGNAELVLPGKTGELVACNSVEGFGQAIASLLDDPARAASYGREGRLRTSELFTASAMIEHHSSLYRELAESSSSNSAR